MGSWKVDESSGFLTNFRGTIKESFAGTDPRYNDGESHLVTWNVEVEEVYQDVDGDVPEEIAATYPVGTGWFTEDGDLLEHPKNKDAFPASSIWGRIIGNVAGQIDGYGAKATRTDGEDLEVDLSALLDLLAERAGDDGPMRVSIWEGLTFDFAEVHFEFGTDKAGKAITSNRTMPVLWHPGDDEAKPAKGKATKASKATKATKTTKKATKAAKSAKTAAPADKVAAARERAAAAKAKTADADAEGIFGFVQDPDIRDQLDGALEEADNYDAFVDAVCLMEDVIGDDDLANQVFKATENHWS